MRIDQVPHQELAALIATGAPVFIQLNPIEYHGPHLPLNNDGLVSQGLCQDIYKKLKVKHPEWPFLEMAPIDIGSEPTPGLGSHMLYMKTLKPVVDAIAKSLIKLNVKSVIWSTFHGAPSHNVAIQHGIDMLWKAGIPSVNVMNLVMDIMVEGKASDFGPAVAHISDSAMRERLANEIVIDLHGGFVETSFTLNYAPHTVSKNLAAIPDCPELKIPGWQMAIINFVTKLGKLKLAKELRFGFLALSWMQIKPFPGYTGRPRFASAQTGLFLSNIVVDKTVRLFETVLEQKTKPARPILEWTTVVQFT